jgi:exopolysaccharide biosynthesis polyprenyl glycosylphosphotransferase
MKNEKNVTELFKVFVYIVDIILVLSSIYLAFGLKFNFHIPNSNYEPFVGIIPFIILAYIIFMHVYGLSDILKFSFSETIYTTLLTVVSLFVTTAFITFFSRGFAYPRSVLVISSLIQFITLILWRIVVWKLKRKAHGIKDALVIGETEAEYVTRKLLLKQRDLYNVKYICSSNNGNLKRCLNEVEVVFICSDAKADIKRSIVDSCLVDRKSVYMLPDIYDIVLSKSKLDRIDDVPMFKVQKLGLTVEQKFLKRLIDVLLAAAGIIITAPVMIVAAIIIKLSDGGSPFYSQVRVTINEEKFKVLKFRTMVLNAEKLTGPVLAGENDPRITRFGKIMRTARIDELPQLFNVLAGSMSIVGPRPERPVFVEKFKEQIPDYKYRTLVKAGLSGLAQVLGKYNTTPEDKVRYDIMYIKNYSIMMDLKLILQTIKIMFMKGSTEGVKQEEVALGQLISDLDLDLEFTIDQEYSGSK